MRRWSPPSSRGRCVDDHYLLVAADASMITTVESRAMLTHPLHKTETWDSAPKTAKWRMRRRTRRRTRRRMRRGTLKLRLRFRENGGNSACRRRAGVRGACAAAGRRILEDWDPEVDAECTHQCTGAFRDSRLNAIVRLMEGVCMLWWSLSSSRADASMITTVESQPMHRWSLPSSRGRWIGDHYRRGAADALMITTV